MLGRRHWVRLVMVALLLTGPCHALTHRQPSWLRNPFRADEAPIEAGQDAAKEVPEESTLEKHEHAADKVAPVVDPPRVTDVRQQAIGYTNLIGDIVNLATGPYLTSQIIHLINVVLHQMELSDPTIVFRVDVQGVLSKADIYSKRPMLTIISSEDLAEGTSFRIVADVDLNQLDLAILIGKRNENFPLACRISHLTATADLTIYIPHNKDQRFKILKRKVYNVAVIVTLGRSKQVNHASSNDKAVQALLEVGLHQEIRQRNFIMRGFRAGVSHLLKKTIPKLNKAICKIVERVASDSHIGIGEGFRTIFNTIGKFVRPILAAFTKLGSNVGRLLPDGGKKLLELSGNHRLRMHAASLLMLENDVDGGNDEASFVDIDDRYSWLSERSNRNVDEKKFHPVHEALAMLHQYGVTSDADFALVRDSWIKLIQTGLHTYVLNKDSLSEFMNNGPDEDEATPEHGPSVVEADFGESLPHLVMYNAPNPEVKASMMKQTEEMQLEEDGHEHETVHSLGLDWELGKHGRAEKVLTIQMPKAKGVLQSARNHVMFTADNQISIFHISICTGPLLLLMRNSPTDSTIQIQLAHFPKIYKVETDPKLYGAVINAAMSAAGGIANFALKHINREENNKRGFVQNMVHQYVVRHLVNLASKIQVIRLSTYVPDVMEKVERKIIVKFEKERSQMANEPKSGIHGWGHRIIQWFKGIFGELHPSAHAPLQIQQADKTSDEEDDEEQTGDKNGRFENEDKQTKDEDTRTRDKDERPEGKTLAEGIPDEEKPKKERI